MPDLSDGETVEVWGTGSKPYLLKNVRGVYSCSCPAWRNQSLPIDRRTCKHLKSQRGDEAERIRVGDWTNEKFTTAKLAVTAPGLLLAETWTEDIDPTGYFLSEKLDGVRAYWDGTRLCSRNGNFFAAPDWFTRQFPSTPLDGELCIGRMQFQRTVSIVRRSDAGKDWTEVRYLVFDAPTTSGPFEERLRIIDDLLLNHRPLYAASLVQTVCRSRDHFDQEFARIQSLGGEGLMLRQAASTYVPRRSATLLKVKSFRDCDAVIVAYEPGKGRHKGRLGSLVVELDDGIRCSVGSGLSDAQRDQPPAIGTVITLKFQELTDGGVPRFPVFAGIRADNLLNSTPSITKERLIMSTAINDFARTRRFEFVEGTSSKFWQIEVNGTEVVVTFGRIGTAGQTNRKQFPDPDESVKHAKKMIHEKVKKGYIEAV